MNDVITSLQNQRVKDAAKLRDRRAREKQRRIIVEGTREIRQAIAAKLTWVEAFVCDELLDEPDRGVVDALRGAGADIVHVTPAVYAKLAYGERVEGIIAVAQTPQRTLDQLELPAKPLVAVIEAMEKPGNIGAMLRTADAAGVSAVVVADGGTDLFNPNSIRASQGAIFHLPLAAGSVETILAWLRQQKVAIFATRVDGAIDYRQADFRNAAAIVLGSEADGLSNAWHAIDVTAIRLPMCGKVDSLNVSVTAGVLFYEALRQRT